MGDPNSDAGTYLWYSKYILCGSFYFVVEKLCNGVVWCGSSDFMKLLLLLCFEVKTHKVLDLFSSSTVLFR